MSRRYYLYSAGSIRQKDKTIEFESGENKRSVPITDIDEIYVMNDMKLTTKLLNILSQYGIPIHFFNYHEFYIGSFYPRESKQAGKLLVQQVSAYTDTEKRLYLAQKILQAAAKNIYRNLRYYNGRGKDCTEAMDKIFHLIPSLEKARTIEELMGIEGNIRREYYSVWNVIINQDIDFTKRVYHPADNMINSMISFVNSMMYTQVLSQIYKTQLNPTISFLHQPGVRRFSLALDVSEIFKPLICDRLIFSLLNRNQITEKSFVQDFNGLRMTEKASKTIAASFDEKLNQTIRHKELNREVSYQYLIRLELYKIIKYLIGEKDYNGFEIWW